MVHVIKEWDDLISDALSLSRSSDSYDISYEKGKSHVEHWYDDYYGNCETEYIDEHIVRVVRHTVRPDQERNSDPG